MYGIASTVAVSLATFATTNIDDLVLLTIFATQRVSFRRLVAAQYIGFAAILVVSLLGAFGTLFIPHSWFRLFGIVPVALGIKELFSPTHQETSARITGIFSIAAVTFTNGADNISVYIPFFAVYRQSLLLALSIYLALIPIWCLLGENLGNHSAVARALNRFGHRFVPVVFIAIGSYLLLRS